MKDMETEIKDLKRDLGLVIKDLQNSRKLFGTTDNDLNKTNMFVKEFYKNLTVINALTDKYNSGIHYLYDFTDAINGTLAKVHNELNEKVILVTKRLEQMESCQSGDNVLLGSHNYPARGFPLEQTIPFQPPFRKIPSLLYCNTLLDPVATS